MLAPFSYSKRILPGRFSVSTPRTRLAVAVGLGEIGGHRGDRAQRADDLVELGSALCAAAGATGRRARAGTAKASAPAMAARSGLAVNIGQVGHAPGLGTGH